MTSSWDSRGQLEASAERDHTLTGLWDRLVGTRLLPPVCWSMDHGVSWFPSSHRLTPRAELTEQRTAVCSYLSLVQLKHSDKHLAVDEGSVNSVLLDRLRNVWCPLLLGWHMVCTLNFVCLVYVLPNQSEAKPS